jgi:hypothetical protein
MKTITVIAANKVISRTLLNAMNHRSMVRRLEMAPSPDGSFSVI